MSTVSSFVAKLALPPEPWNMKTMPTAFVNAGLWNSAGHLLVSIPAVQAALPSLTYPANVNSVQKQLLRDQVNVVLAVHEYSATYALQTVAFFDAH